MLPRTTDSTDSPDSIDSANSSATPGTSKAAPNDDVAATDIRKVIAHPAVVRVRAALADLGAPGSVVVLDNAAHTAALAAEFLGITVGQIANSLVFAARHDDGQHTPVLIMTSGAHRVDVRAVAARLGYAALERADADLVRASTGFAIGGVAPVGHLTTIPTHVDEALAAHDVIWAAAGHPRTVFPTTYDELVRITGGSPIRVT